MSEVRAEALAARAALLPKLPALRVGDRWHMGGKMATIVGFDSLEEDGFPWPMVRYRYEAAPLVWSAGAPAFVFATLQSRGDGEAWNPMEVAA